MWHQTRRFRALRHLHKFRLVPATLLIFSWESSFAACHTPWTSTADGRPGLDHGRDRCRARRLGHLRRYILRARRLG